MASSASIHFHSIVGRVSLRERTRLKAFLLRMIQKAGRKVETINYIFCSDDYLVKLNLSYLKHDTYTDIITFELSAPDAPLVADIYISVERVRENARHFGSSFNRELHRVIFHGALHLCGFKDKTNKQSLEMRAMEELQLKKYQVPRGTSKNL
jgi:probable rRNA maturation factor